MMPHATAAKWSGSNQSLGTIDDNDRANAALIAAAPDLLVALRAMCAVQNRRRHPLGLPNEGIAGDAAEAMSKARAAIARAEA